MDREVISILLARVQKHFSCRALRSRRSAQERLHQFSLFEGAADTHLPHRRSMLLQCVFVYIRCNYMHFTVCNAAYTIEVDFFTSYILTVMERRGSAKRVKTNSKVQTGRSFLSINLEQVQAGEKICFQGNQRAHNPGLAASTSLARYLLFHFSSCPGGELQSVLTQTFLNTGPK